MVLKILKNEGETMIPSDILAKEKLFSTWSKKAIFKRTLSLKKLRQNCSRFNLEVIDLIFLNLRRERLNP